MEYPPDLDPSNWINTEVWIDTEDGTIFGQVIQQRGNVLTLWTGDRLLTTLANKIELKGTTYSVCPDDR